MIFPLYVNSAPQAASGYLLEISPEILEAHKTYSLEVLVVYHNVCMSKSVVSHFE